MKYCCIILPGMEDLIGQAVAYPYPSCRCRIELDIPCSCSSHIGTRDCRCQKSWAKSSKVADFMNVPCSVYPGAFLICSARTCTIGKSHGRFTCWRSLDDVA